MFVTVLEWDLLFRTQNLKDIYEQCEAVSWHVVRTEAEVVCDKFKHSG